MIQLVSTERALTSASVVMSNWAFASPYQTDSETTGFMVPLTLNIYKVGDKETVGDQIATSYLNAFIAWRAEPSGGCVDNGWRASDGVCRGGVTSIVTFSFNNEILSDKVIFGLTFNTETYGAEPTGASGPYNSLNFGLATAAPTVGSNPLPNTAYWNTSHAPFYNDKGLGGVSTFRQDTNWAPYSGAISLSANAVPEPSTWGLMGLGLTFLAVRRFRK